MRVGLTFLRCWTGVRLFGSSLGRFFYVYVVRGNERVERGVMSRNVPVVALGIVYGDGDGGGTKSRDEMKLSIVGWMIYRARCF